MESINNRRTIRKYKQEDISASLLNDLLEKAFRASTMGNMQLYSVIVFGIHIQGFTEYRNIK